MREDDRGKGENKILRFGKLGKGQKGILYYFQNFSSLKLFPHKHSKNAGLKAMYFANLRD